MEDAQILIVEDEEDILDVLKYNLHKAGYRTLEAPNGETARNLIREATPNLILLDLMLPGINGLDLCKILKKDGATKGIPIVMLTAKSSEEDIVAGLEMGAEDYVVKPFSPRILLARIQNILLRNQKSIPEEGSSLKCGSLEIHPARHLALVDGQPVLLTTTEFRILHFLARHPGWVYTRDQIIDATHGENYIVTDRAIDVQIVGLRKKLGESGNLIETVRGIGYRFQGQD
ncbi:MAG: response regulator [SAR324 cluster bacterium]|nr:response regulator [SAR324 cluster bacterium]